MERNIGIWMDLDKALIIENGKSEIEQILSEVEHFNISGGARGKTAYGTQDATSESKLLERKKHQLKNYFNDIISHISKVDKLVVFGPAETKNAFIKMASENTSLKDIPFGVETTGNDLSDNQLVEWVRNYFHNENSL